MTQKWQALTPARRDHQGMNDLLEQLAVQFNLRPDEIRPHPSGAANHVYTLGPDLILRVPRSPGFGADLAKESSVIPYVRSAGIRTPAVVAQGTDPVAYMVLDRVAGQELNETNAREELWRDLAGELARLHQLPPGPTLPTDNGGHPETVTEQLTAMGLLDTGTAAWLARLGRRFDPGERTVLLHGDIAPQNLLVDSDDDGDGRLAAVIDWGDTGYGPPALDFAKLRPEQAALVLPAYVEQVPWADLEELAAGILWYQVGWGLGRLAVTPRPGQRHWTAPPASRILGVLRFALSDPPSPWAGLLRVAGSRSPVTDTDRSRKCL